MNTACHETNVRTADRLFWFRFSAEPKRWISVTAPGNPVARVRSACLN